jgi:hypothetical protein
MPDPARHSRRGQRRLVAGRCDGADRNPTPTEWRGLPLCPGSLSAAPPFQICTGVLQLMFTGYPRGRDHLICPVEQPTKFELASTAQPRNSAHAGARTEQARGRLSGLPPSRGPRPHVHSGRGDRRNHATMIHTKLEDVLRLTPETHFGQRTRSATAHSRSCSRCCWVQSPCGSR